MLQLIGNRLLDNGTLEEARVVACVQHCGIGDVPLGSGLAMMHRLTELPRGIDVNSISNR